MRKPNRYFAVAGLLATLMLGSPALATQKPKVDATIDKRLDHTAELINAERLDEALVVLKSIEPDKPKVRAEIDTLLGNIYLRLDKPAKALEFFEHASLSTMDDAEAFLGMAEANLSLGKLQRARRHASVALKTNPDLTRAHLIIAKIDDRSGNVDAAEKRFARLLKDRPNSEAVAVALAYFKAHRDGVKSGIEVLEKFVRRDPTAAEASDLLGQFYWEHGNRSEAIEYRRLAAEAFAARTNRFRADAIRRWLRANGAEFSSKRRLTPSPGKQKAQPTPQQTPPSKKQLPTRKPTEQVKVLKRPEPLPFMGRVSLKTGSGFIIGGGKYVVTNRHVIDKTGKLAVRSGTGEVRLARIKRIAEKDDIAILELARPYPADYAISSSQMKDAMPGRAAIVMGFPLAGLVGWRHPSLTEGIVSKTSGLSDNPTMFLITSKMNKGNSGGPIFDHTGNLIGIAVAKLDTAKIFDKKGHLPEDVNIGIKASRLLEFLSGQEIDRAPQGDGITNLEELYRSMLKKVVLVAGESR
jgi:serine protease Do